MSFPKATYKEENKKNWEVMHQNWNKKCTIDHTYKQMVVVLQIKRKKNLKKRQQTTKGIEYTSATAITIKFSTIYYSFFVSIIKDFFSLNYGKLFLFHSEPQTIVNDCHFLH